MKKQNIEIIKLFEVYKINLDKKDINTINRESNIKPLIVYRKAIEFLIENNEILSYDAVICLLKLNKIFLREVLIIIFGVEELFRSKLINELEKKEKKVLSEEIYKRVYKMSFESVINLLYKLEVINFEFAHEIRRLRNKCSHLQYIILNGEAGTSIDILTKIGTIPFVDEKAIKRKIEKLKSIEIGEKFNFYKKIMS